jgi:fatty-acyl-CoA synthase
MAEREGTSLMTIVGDAFARPLLDGLDRRNWDLSRLFVLGSGGAILSPHNKQAFLERIPHVTIVDGFGASETGAHGSHASRAGEQVSTGQFSMQHTIVLRNDLSGTVEPGSDEIGWVGRSGNVPLGYYKDAAKTARTFPVLRGTRYAVPGDHARVLATGRSSSSGAARCRSTRAARRSTRRRWSRSSAAIPRCTTRSSSARRRPLRRAGDGRDPAARRASASRRRS